MYVPQTLVAAAPEDRTIDFSRKHLYEQKFLLSVKPDQFHLRKEVLRTYRKVLVMGNGKYAVKKASENW